MSETTEVLSHYNAVLICEEGGGVGGPLFRGLDYGHYLPVKVGDNFAYRRELYTLDLPEDITVVQIAFPVIEHRMQGIRPDRAARFYVNRMIIQPLLVDPRERLAESFMSGFMSRNEPRVTPVDLFMKAAPDEWQLSKDTLAYFECLLSMLERVNDDLKAIGRRAYALAQANGQPDHICLYFKTQSLNV